MTAPRRHLLSRRHLLLSAVAASAGCALRAGTPSSSAAPPPAARPPLVGQSWRYSRYDYISGAFLDSQTDRIAAVGSTIEIESHRDPAKQAVKSSWGSELLHKFHGTEAANAPLGSEIQNPWGMVVVDPHWGAAQAYEVPIPLWPAQLQPGWRIHLRTRYKSAGNDQPLPWEQTMEALHWEMLTGPAGQFRTLRLTNLIKFEHPDPARTNSVRRETLWFAPEIGRWVERESVGTYYLDDSVDDTAFNESSYRWQLTEWT